MPQTRGTAPITIRRAGPQDADGAAEVVRRSFVARVAADWTPEAGEAFLRSAAPEPLRQSLRAAAFAALALEPAGEPLGLLLMPTPALLGMLFVDPSVQRRGIATRLWEAAREHVEQAYPEVKTIELNATPHAVGFYRSAGFVPISREFALAGCRATRMACWLPARRLDAQLH